MDSFLMLGQSNMAGRGDIGSVKEIRNSKLFMLRNGRWQPLSEPVNPDRAVFGTSRIARSGISLAVSFADEYSHFTGAETGLIPCADGGTSLDDWAQGSLLFDNAVSQAKLAMRTSTLKAVLWHHGESDSITAASASAYELRCKKIIIALLSEIGAPNTPVIMGEIGDFVKKRCPYYATVNTAINNIAANPAFAAVSAKGLSDRGDGLHFSAEACREFGKRYFIIYKAKFL